jgi:hypothetical protein
MKLYSTGAIVMIILTISQQAFAQLSPIYGSGYQNLINTLLTNKIWEMSMDSYTKKGSKRSPGTARSTSTTPNTVPSYGDVVENTAVTPEQVKRAVQFRSTGTRLLLDEYLDALGGTPQDKSDTKVLLTGFLNRFDAEAAAQGYPNDLALALVTYIVVNSAVYSDKPLLPTEQILEMRYLLAINAARAGSFKNTTDRERQSAYEFSLMTAGMIQYFFAKAKSEKNVEELEKCKVVAAHNLKMLGIEP